MPSRPAKLDFRRAFPAYYSAGKEPALANFGAVPYLALEGQGAPGGPEFQQAIGDLFATAFTLKFQGKQAGQDFTVPALEAQFWAEAGETLATMPASRMHWKLLLRMPPKVTRSAVAKACRGAIGKGHPGAGEIQLERLNEGECLQALHVGPYKDEPATVGRMQKQAAAMGRRPTGRHHEIYLNDPRRVGESKAKTILRMPVMAMKKGKKATLANRRGPRSPRPGRRNPSR